MLFDRGLSIFCTSSLKQHIKYNNFRCLIQLDLPVSCSCIYQSYLKIRQVMGKWPRTVGKLEKLFYLKYRGVKNYSCMFVISPPSAARQLGQPMHIQSANFGKFKLNSRNLAGIILHHSASSLGVIEELSCVIGLLGRSGLAATLGQHCP